MSEQFINDLLKQIKYPGFSRDIVSFGLIQESHFENGQASVKLEVNASEPTLPKILKEEIEQTLLKHDQVKRVEVQITVKKAPATSNVQGDGQENGILPGVKKIVAIASGKGGVGKSTMAVNLACAIERILRNSSSKSAKIGLMDCDVYGPSVPLLIGASGQPKALGENHIAPVESYGIKVMSMGLLVDEETPVVWRGPMGNSALAMLDILSCMSPTRTGTEERQKCA